MKRAHSHINFSVQGSHPQKLGVKYAISKSAAGDIGWRCHQGRMATVLSTHLESTRLTKVALILSIASWPFVCQSFLFFFFNLPFSANPSYRGLLNPPSLPFSPSQFRLTSQCAFVPISRSSLGKAFIIYCLLQDD